MNDQSHVSLEQKVCLVCGETYDTGTILLDRRLQASMPHRVTTGWGLCSDHQRKHDEGFIALIECDVEKSGAPSSANSLKPEDAYRTGRVAHLKREAFTKVFDTTVSADLPCVFVTPDVIDRLQAMTRLHH